MGRNRTSAGIGRHWRTLTAIAGLTLGGAAVAQDGRALKHASAELQADRDVVLAAVPLAQRRTATRCLSEPYLMLPHTLIS